MDHCQDCHHPFSLAYWQPEHSLSLSHLSGSCNLQIVINWIWPNSRPAGLRCLSSLPRNGCDVPRPSQSVRPVQPRPTVSLLELFCGLWWNPITSSEAELDVMYTFHACRVLEPQPTAHDSCQSGLIQNYIEISQHESCASHELGLSSTNIVLQSWVNNR